MKKQLDKADIINLLNDSNYFTEVTRPSADSFQVKIKPRFYPCYICSRQINYKLVEIRLDAKAKPNWLKANK